MTGVPLHSPYCSDVPRCQVLRGGGIAVNCMGDERTALKVPEFYLCSLIIILC